MEQMNLSGIEEFEWNRRIILEYIFTPAETCSISCVVGSKETPPLCSFPLAVVHQHLAAACTFVVGGRSSNRKTEPIPAASSLHPLTYVPLCIEICGCFFTKE